MILQNMEKSVSCPPVVFIIFNRPDLTERVFEAIAKAKPKRLLVIADGPRFPEEAEKCQKARAVIKKVDWDCKVDKDYSDMNLGLERRVSTGLDWAFNRVSEAIILEDDCVPHPTFFRFCQELLERFRNDRRIMVISGQNLQFGNNHTNYSYYFSRYNHCWGWASWRRAWQLFDFDMKLWPEIRDGQFFTKMFSNAYDASYWTNIFQSLYDGRLNSWAYRWTLTCWINSGLTILPSVNLISNIGFGIGASNTADANSFLANMPTNGLEFPLKHPPFVIRNFDADEYTQSNIYNPQHRHTKSMGISRFNLFSSMKRKIGNLLRSMRLR